ncbi:MAG: hypothetical protein R3C05_30390 [Pirellulaceae bacterium]
MAAIRPTTAIATSDAPGSHWIAGMAILRAVTIGDNALGATFRR